MDKIIFDDFQTFSRALITTKDVDPTYPLIKSVCDRFAFIPEWFAFVYVSFYNIESGIKVCDMMPTTDRWDKELFLSLRKNTNKFGHERRGHSRSPEVMANGLEHAKDFIENMFLDIFDNKKPFKDSKDLRQKLEQLPNIGGWAAFKIAEIFDKSMKYQAAKVSDLGLEGRDPNSNDGPVGGLRWLFGRDSQYSTDIFPYWEAFGAELAREWGVCVGEVETCLCKFHKLKTGKYYIGHDIDEFHDLEVFMGKVEFDSLFEDSGFDRRVYGGSGVVKSLKKLYADRGVIHNNHFASDSIPEVNIIKIALNV